ncbi:hypothetical protein Tco_0381148, partial [Tanacetum coccineum]
DDVIAEQAMKESSRTAEGRRKKSLARKRARETLSEESDKKQKLEDDTEKEELQVYLNIVPEDESINVESLATKQDVLELYRLVKERFQIASPEGYDLLLWGDLKTLIEPNEEDEIWRNQQDWNLINWKKLEVDHQSDMGYELIRISTRRKVSTASTELNTARRLSTAA